MAQQIYSFLNLFRLDIDPMERLLLINFEKDADTTYIGFEPQVFDDSVNGKGHLVIGWRLDGQVDVFHQPSLKIDPRKYNIAGKGLANSVEQAFDEAHYEINDFGVQAFYRFKDIYNRAILLKINEKNPKKRKPFGLLAPMGAAAEHPSSMPLVLLHDFYFVRKKETTIEISIDGKIHRPDELPIPMDGTKMLFTRYSPSPLIVTFNPAADEMLVPIEIEQGTTQFTTGEYDFELEWANDRPALNRIVRNNGIYPVELRFVPPFPDLQSPDIPAKSKGGFEIEGHPATGRIIGHYIIENKADETSITLVPSKGWKPRPDKFSLRFLYTVARVFKKWPTTYEWTAIVTKTANGPHHLQSNWRRTK